MSNRTVLTIGNFDGVHVGHQAIVRRAAAAARRHDARVVAITIDPHPATVLRPGAEPRRLTCRQQKDQALRAAGADDVVVLEPTRELLGSSAEQFTRRLKQQYAPVAFVEGRDFRFGRGRGGNLDALARMGRELGFDVLPVEPVEVALTDQLLVRASSTLIRWLLSCGRVADAARCLGRSYTLSAEVVEGQRRGRRLDVPTVNLDPAGLTDRALPADGVYAGEVSLPDGRARPAAISVGTKPTFDEEQRIVEAHLLDFADDVYGLTVGLRFARWVRDQQAFPDVQSLRRQLHRDIALTRRWHELGLLGEPSAATRMGRAG